MAAPTQWTGTTWPGSYGSTGQLYYHPNTPGQWYTNPQDLYKALGGTYDPNSLPYGTVAFSQGYNSGVSPWDTSVQNAPNFNLDTSSLGTGAGLYAAPTAASLPQPTSRAPTASADTGTTAATTTPSTTGAVPFSTQYPGPTNMPGQWTPAASTAATTTPTTTAASTTPTDTTTTTSTPTAAAGGTTTTPTSPSLPPQPAGPYIPGPNSTTAADVFNPLDDPKQAVYRALLAGGYNPDVPTFGTQQLLKRAADLVWGGVGRIAQGGNPDVLTTPGSMQDYVAGLVNRAGMGQGGVMPGRDEGRAGLNAINDLINSARNSSGTAGAGATYLGSLFGADPAPGIGLADRLMYSGLAPSVRSALQAPLANYVNRFNMMTETPEGFGIATQHNALDILLNSLIPGYKTPLF